jgi:hypothetical protein
VAYEDRHLHVHVARSAALRHAFESNPNTSLNYFSGHGGLEIRLLGSEHPGHLD